LLVPPERARSDISGDPVIPEIESITPDSGPITGGTEITIKGKTFESDATVRIGDEYATDVTIVDSETITAKTPSSETVYWNGRNEMDD
jgi:hypothetical protein